jgi:exosortase
MAIETRMQDGSIAIARRHACFALFVVITSAVFYKALATLVSYSLHDDSSSHIALVPWIAVFLVCWDRRRIFSSTNTDLWFGSGLILGGTLLYLYSRHISWLQEGNWSLSLSVCSIILTWAGGFAACYGVSSLRAAIFPVCFLLLMIPLPDAILDRVIRALQDGSAVMACLIFKLVGIPVWRNGLLLSVPGVTIEVAKECSSIRSSIALVITCLLAAHLYLRTGWKILLLVVLSLILSVVKNGVRIATLTVLSIYVDPGFLFGKLHREGGFAFFLFALLLIWPVFTLLERSDRPQRASISIP